MNPLALLKLLNIGPRDYLYAALAVVLVAVGAWFVHHERAIGAARVEVADAKLARAEALHNADAQALAAMKTVAIGDVYESTIHSDPVDPPHVVCVAPRGSQLPEAAGHSGSDHGAPAERAEDPVDIGPPLTAVGRDADAQIKALQEQVRVLTDEMNGITK